MLVTGVLLVPIGIVLFGVAMRSASAFGPRLATVTVGLGLLGIVGAAIVPGSAAAAAVLVIVLFNLLAGQRTLSNRVHRGVLHREGGQRSRAMATAAAINAGARSKSRKSPNSVFAIPTAIAPAA